MSKRRALGQGQYIPADLSDTHRIRHSRDTQHVSGYATFQVNRGSRLGNWKLEAGNWKREAGNWKLEAGSGKLEADIAIK